MALVVLSFVGSLFETEEDKELITGIKQDTGAIETPNNQPQNVETELPNNTNVIQTAEPINGTGEDSHVALPTILNVAYCDEPDSPMFGLILFDNGEFGFAELWDGGCEVTGNYTLVDNKYYDCEISNAVPEVGFKAFKLYPTDENCEVLELDPKGYDLGSAKAGQKFYYYGSADEMKQNVFPEQTYDFGDYTITLSAVYIEPDSKQMLACYEFENFSGETRAFWEAFQCNIFQEQGADLESIYFSKVSGALEDNKNTRIRSGSSITICDMRELQSLDEPIYIQLDSWWTDDDITFTVYPGDCYLWE